MDKIKPFSIRIPKDLWFFLKKQSAKKELSMNEIIIKTMEKYRDNHEKSVDSW